MRLITCLVSGLISVSSLRAEEVVLPFFRAVEGHSDQITSEETTKSLRLLVEHAHPPFSYRDQNNDLRGFSIDLARALCAELSLICEISDRPQGGILSELDQRAGDVVLGNFTTNSILRQAYELTHSYFLSPARFIVGGQISPDLALSRHFANETVGVIRGSAHQRFLKDAFPMARPRLFDQQSALFQALYDKTISFAFIDALPGAFWLLSDAGKACCDFVGGAYFDNRYFGTGLVMVLRKTDWRLRQQLDIALMQLNDSGRYAEIYLKHFPKGLF